jgi:hypothetical protein
MLIRLSLHELFGEASHMLHELIDIQAGAGSLRNSRSDMAEITGEQS